MLKETLPSGNSLKDYFSKNVIGSMLKVVVYEILYHK